MRALLVTAAAALALAAPAHAGPVEQVVHTLLTFTDPMIVPPVVQAVSPVSREFTVAAYGEGATTCTMRLERYGRSFAGSTACTAAIEQTGQASTDTGAAGPLCSGTRNTCTSSGTAPSDFSRLRYRVTLRAPNGQGWAASPQECSGTGTDNLECEFVF